MASVVLWSFVVTVTTFLVSSNASHVRELSEDNWTEMLNGEWLVKFYAPWCPACQSLTATWELVAERVQDLNVHVAEVDVTKNPALSGRFFVTALPTIFHIKDGVFRQFKQARSDKNFYNFVAENKWQEVEPVPWYQSPTSIHMSFLGMFFRFSMAIRDIHSTMMSDYGIPVWGSYFIFALATILLGLFIGLLIVCLCDLRQPTNMMPSRSVVPENKHANLASGDGSTYQAEDSDLPDTDKDEDKVSDAETLQSENTSKTTLRHRDAKLQED